MKSSSRGLGWGLMNNSEVLRYPSWVYNSSFSRCLHCFKLMNHYWVSQALSSTVSLPLASLLLLPAKHNRKCLPRSSYPSTIPMVEAAATILLAAPVYFTTGLKISLIFLHHLLYSLRICHNIESALSKTQRFWSSGKSNVGAMKECDVIGCLERPELL